MPAAPELLARFDPQVLAALSGLDLQARYLVEGFLQGLHRSPFHGFSVEFSEYRDYQPGDDLRHLDWRLFARSDRLCVKKYTQETNVRFYLLLDTSGSMGYRGREAWGSKLDVARVTAAALVWMLLAQNDAAGLLAFGPDAVRSDDTAPAAAPAAAPDFIRPSQKPSQFGLLLNHLELLRPQGGERLAKLLEHAVRLMHRRSVVLFFSDLLEPSERLQALWKQLRFLGHECLIFQVLDRDEIEFPFTEGALFEDLEGESVRRVDPAAVRERYLARFQSFMEAHHETFRGLEWPYCVLRTDRDPWAALAAFLAERRRLL
jgi:uncharacterized protein (DUF58 family)